MRAIERLVPTPWLSFGLFLLWLGLSREASAGQVVLGLALGVVVPLLIPQLRLPLRARQPLLIARFISMVSWDVVVSNLQVARGVARWGFRKPSARFVTIPLDMRDPLGLSVLAMVTTVVPGTVWAELALDRSKLLLHVWDVDEVETFVARFKNRYEKPLMEIFE